MPRHRLLPATLGLLAAALIVLAALLPEYEEGGVGVALIDPDRAGWVPLLVGVLVEVGLVLSASLMLLLRESRLLAGGILLGAGILGLTLRVVRLFQLAEIPDLEGADGSWVDALAAAVTVTAGVLAVSSVEDQDLDEGEDQPYEGEDSSPLAPLPEEPTPEP